MVQTFSVFTRTFIFTHYVQLIKYLTYLAYGLSVILRTAKNCSVFIFYFFFLIFNISLSLRYLILV